MKIKINNQSYLPLNPLAAVQILFPIEATSHEKTIKSHVKIIISDMVANNWGFSIWSKTPEVDYAVLAKIAIQKAIPILIKLVKSDNILKEYVIVLDSTNCSGFHDLEVSSLSEVSNIEFETL